MTERWHQVPGWEQFYAVSDLGNVRSLARAVPGRPGVNLVLREKLLRPHRNRGGYLQVALSRDNKRTTVGVHRLVLAAFVGESPDGTEACHGDGDKANNALTNLRWGTRSDNTYDRIAHGTHSQARKTHCPAGHPYNDLNTYTSPSGSRMCRTCRADKKRARRLSGKKA